MPELGLPGKEKRITKLQRQHVKKQIIEDNCLADIIITRFDFISRCGTSLTGSALASAS
jgi:hypothetical protein